MRTALPRILLVTVAVILATSLRPPQPASALVHLAEIHEVLSGFDGDPAVQYVEVNMRSTFQNFTVGVKLSAFDASGTFIDGDTVTPGDQPLLVMSGNVSSGSVISWSCSDA